MPRRRNAVKRLRVDKKKHLINLRSKRQLKETIKKFGDLLSSKNFEEAKKLLSQIYARLDKAAKKRTVHPNTANRKKSRLTLALIKATTNY